MAVTLKLRRRWHGGPPPHVGWWNVQVIDLYYGVTETSNSWSWWNGKNWGGFCGPRNSAEVAAERALQTLKVSPLIIWSRYWPKDARVKRVKP